MMQNINLHKIQFPPKHNVKISKKMSVIIIIVFISLVSIISLAYWKIESLKAEYKSITKNSSTTQSAINKIKSELESSANDNELKIKLLSIKDKLKHKLALKEKLDEESSDISSSFYQRFVALSRQDIKGVWLTDIVFSEKGKSLTLSGIAQTPELLTIYIQKLSNEAIFNGITFDLLSIQNDKNNSRGYSQFTISSEFEEAITPFQEALGKIQ